MMTHRPPTTTADPQPAATGRRGATAMTTTRTLRRARRPLSDQDYADRAMCACPLLPRGHQALHCRLMREQNGSYRP